MFEIQHIFHLLGFATLARIRRGEFQLIGPAPEWWTAFAPESGFEIFSPADQFPFLANFLVDAELVWNGEGDVRVDSGIWEQAATGSDQAAILLEAIAVRDAERQYLVIRNLSLGDDLSQHSIQVGRSGRLEHLRDIGRRRQLQIALQSAKDSAERLDRAKTEFVAGISHEMLTPLTNILGLSEVLLDSPQGDAQRQQLHEVASSARGLVQTVQKLLAMSQIESRGFSIDVESFDLPALIHEIYHDYQPAAVERGLTIHLTLDPGLPETAISDRHCLRQAIINLVDNAIKFTERGNVTLHAFPREEDVAIAVADTGIGISGEHQAQVQDSFAQVDSSFTRRYEGIGLGLTLASRLARALGGRIKVESDLGVGSCFTLIFPREIPAALRPDAVLDAWDQTQLHIGRGRSSRATTSFTGGRGQQDQSAVHGPHFDQSRTSRRSGLGRATSLGNDRGGGLRRPVAGLSNASREWV